VDVRPTLDELEALPARLRAFDYFVRTAGPVVYAEHVASDVDARLSRARLALAHLLGTHPPGANSRPVVLVSGRLCSVRVVHDTSSGLAWTPGQAPAGDVCVLVQMAPETALLALGYMHREDLGTRAKPLTRKRGEAGAGATLRGVERYALRPFTALLRAELAAGARVLSLVRCARCHHLLAPAPPGYGIDVDAVPWCLAPGCAPRRRAEA
jgi:hypothetical protein